MAAALAALRDRPAPLLLALFGASLPISTAATNILAALVLLLVIAQVRYRSRLRAALGHPVVLLALILWLLLGLAVSYSNAPLASALQTFRNYRKLLLLALLVPLFQDSAGRRAGLAGLEFGLAVTLVLSYSNVLTGWPPAQPPLLEAGVVFKNHITQGLLLALAAYLWALRALGQSGWRRWSLLLAALLATYNVIFITLGKSGYLVLITLSVLGAVQLDRWRGLIIGSAVVVAVGLLAYAGSTAVQQRIDHFRRHLEQSRPGLISSAGLRLDYYRYTPRLIAEHPLIGGGTGSFATEYRRLAARYHILPSDNPHDEFLLLGVQLGLPGMALFIALLAALWHWSSGLAERPYRWSGQALVVFMATGCLFNSLLLDSTEGYLFAFLAALICAVPDRRRHPRDAIGHRHHL